MKKMFFALMIALLAFTGCLTDSGDDDKDDANNGGSSGGVTVAEYLPFAAGSQWQFASTTVSSDGNNETGSYTLICTGTTTINGKTYWAMASTDDYDDTYMRVEGSIVYIYENTDYLGKRAAAKAILKKAAQSGEDLPMFDFGKKSGQTWQIFSKSGSEEGGSYTVSMTGKHGGTETVTTPAGTFSNCVKFLAILKANYKSQEYSFSWTSTQTMWFAKGVGPVKSLSEDVEGNYSSTTTEVLTSYQTGGGNTSGSYSVTGKIESSTGGGVSGVTVTLSGGGKTATATTDANGNYSFAAIANGSYTVTPVKTGYTFSPATRQITVSGQNATVSPIAGFASGGGSSTYDVSGVVLDEKGAPMEYVHVMLQDTKNALNAYVIYTDGQGSYSFDDIVASTYTLSFAYDYYTFPTHSITFTGSAITMSPVSGTPVSGSSTYTVSGKIVDTFGTGLSGFNVSIVGGGTTYVQSTDSGGHYSFIVTQDGVYTIIPSRENYTFLPVEVTVIVAGNHVTVQNIIATPLGSGSGDNNYYVISGTVRDNKGVALEWTMVELKGISLSKDDFGYANESGRYEINYLKNGTYLLTPSYADYTFTPATMTVTVNGANVTGVDFVATPVGSSNKTGHVTGKLTNGDQLIVATLSGEGRTFTADTGYAGSFEFYPVPYGTYTLTFQQKAAYHPYNYTFTPEVTTVVVDSPTVSVTGIAYAQTLKPLYQVTGTVTFSSSDKYFPGKGSPNVDIVLTVADGPFAEEAVYYGISTADGTWKIVTIDGVPSGRYRVVATSGYYGVMPDDFDPKETFVVVGNGAVSGINFVLNRK